MYRDDDEIIEVAGGGSIFTDMTLYDSWAITNYTVSIVPAPPKEDVIVYTSSDSEEGLGDPLAASLWLFNDGTTPLPSNEIKFYLSNPKLTKFDYTDGGASLGAVIRPIVSAFDPSLITSLTDLLALDYGVDRVVFGMTSTTAFTETNESSATEFNYFYLSGESEKVFGVIILFDNGTITGATSDVEFQVNSKTLRVVLE